MITLRALATGERVGAGHVAQRMVAGKLGGWYVVDSWSESTCRVYARSSGHIPPAPLNVFNPSELGLYIGHERGQQISEIKWGKTQHVEPYVHPATRIEAVRRYNEYLDAEERSPTGDDYNALLRILGV